MAAEDILEHAFGKYSIHVTQESTNITLEVIVENKMQVGKE